MLQSTGTIDNLNASIVTYTPNVERWQGGSVILRGASAAGPDVFQALPAYPRLPGTPSPDRCP